MTALCVWYSQHVSDSDTSWHGAAGEQLQCVIIIIETQRSVFTIPDESEHSGVQASYSQQMEIITKEVGGSHSYTHIRRTTVSIDLLVAVSLIRQNTERLGRVHGSNTDPVISLWSDTEACNSTAPPHSLWTWLGCFFLQTLGLFTCLQMFTEAAMHWFFKNTVVKMLSHHQLKRSKVICIWLVNIFIFTRWRLSPSN